MISNPHSFHADPDPHWSSATATAVITVRAGKVTSRWMRATRGTTATAEKPWQWQKISATTGTVSSSSGSFRSSGVKNHKI
jgi:hypothetical protein